MKPRPTPLEGGPTFSLRHRAFRAAWNFTWLVLAAWTPPPLHRWRNLVLRGFGAKLHPTARVYGGARVWYPPLLTMDKHAVLARRVDCYNMDQITISAYAIVSQGAYLCAGTHDIRDRTFPLVTRPITIGAYAWVASEAFVGPGVTIGDGAVLGARGVATRDLAPWTIYSGNPAQSLGPRVWRGEPG